LVPITPILRITFPAFARRQQHDWFVIMAKTTRYANQILAGFQFAIAGEPVLRWAKQTSKGAYDD
jgi:hypothetical protein